MNHYLVSYQDTEGYIGTTTMEYPTPLTESDAVGAINEQLAANGIEAEVVQIRVLPTTKFKGMLLHYLYNKKGFCLEPIF